MKHVLISYHPYEKSFNAAIVKRIKEVLLENKGHTVEHIDLAQIQFNPVMTAKELFEFSQARTPRGIKIENLDPLSVQFAEKINGCDHLILVFPIWWELMPAQMKGFIDKVIFPELFYTYKSEFSMKAISNTLNKVTVITTMNTPHFLYSLKYKNCVYNALVNGTFKKLGIKNVRWINYGFVKKINDSKRKRILERIPQNLSI